MTEQKYTPSNFDSANLITFLIKWKKPLLIIGIAAAFSSAVVSFIIEPKYKATVILFPAKTTSISRALLTEDVGGKHDVLAFGEEEEAERLIQVLNSDEIRNKIDAKYNLMQHYEILPDDKYKNTKLIKEYEDNISFKRTEFQSVKVDVLDKSPDTAAFIANDIADFLDSVMDRMQKERAVKALQIVEREYLKLSNYMQLMQDSMTALRKLGVYDYEAQVERMTEYYSKAISEGKTEAAKKLEDKLNELGKYGSIHISLKTRLEEETKKVASLRAKYDEAKVDAEQQIPSKFIVNSAFSPEKKTYPVRWLIVVVSTLSALLIGVLAIIGIENYKKYSS